LHGHNYEVEVILQTAALDGVGLRVQGSSPLCAHQSSQQLSFECGRKVLARRFVEDSIRIQQHAASLRYRGEFESIIVHAPSSHGGYWTGHGILKRAPAGCAGRAFSEICTANSNQR
jgi:hypothetical protein